MTLKDGHARPVLLHEKRQKGCVSLRLGAKPAEKGVMCGKTQIEAGRKHPTEFHPMLNDLEALPKICAYCRSPDDLTKEHVIPRSFEAENARNWEPVIVWACKACNNAKSRLDSKVRELFAVDVVGGNHETAQKLMEGKIRRAVERSAELGHRNTLTELFKEMVPTTLHREDGTAYVSGMGAKLPEDYFTPWFTFVVKGLSMALSNERFVTDASFKVSRYYPDSFATLKEALKSMNAPEPVRLGTHTTFTYRSVDDWPFGTGMWLFEFYGGVVFDVMVAPSELTDQLEADVATEAAKNQSE